MREGRVTFEYRKSGNGHVLHGMDTKTKKKDQEQKENQSWRAGKDRCAFGRVSVQETVYTHFHTGHVVSSLACDSHISILVNSGAKHFAFWQKTIHLHLPLSTMPWAGKKHWHLMWNVCKRGLVDLQHTCAVPRQSTMSEMNGRHMSTLGGESFTMWNEARSSWGCRHIHICYFLLQF